MRESNTVLINNSVAENAECSCRGRNWRIARLNQLPGAAVLEAEDSATMSRFYTEQPCEPDTADGSRVTKVYRKMRTSRRPDVAAKRRNEKARHDSAGRAIEMTKSRQGQHSLAFVNHSTFHHKTHMLERPNIRQRIVIHRNNVRILAITHGSDLI